MTGPEIDEYRRQVWGRYDYSRSLWCFVGIKWGSSNSAFQRLQLFERNRAQS